MLLTVLVVWLMVTIAALASNKEIVFPEITALAVGTLIAPTISWKTSRVKMVALIAISSVFGLIMALIPLSIVIKVPVAFLVCNVILINSKTTFAPLISAAILPILMNSNSIIYPISAVLFTVVIIILEELLVMLGIKVREEYIPGKKPRKRDYLVVYKRTIIVFALSIIAFGFFDKFYLAPPLLVAFTEFTNPLNKARKTPLKTIAVISLCAVIGAYSRIILSGLLGMPIILSAVVATVLLIITMSYAKMFIPPAGALAILPIIIPYKYVAIYPYEIFVGALVLMFVASTFFGDETEETEGRLLKRKSTAGSSVERRGRNEKVQRYSR